MKIAIMGHSGSGKSTLTRNLSEKYQIPSLHLDQLQFKRDWEIQHAEVGKQRVSTFLDLHDSWVIDGNYDVFLRPRRVEEADYIVVFMYSRWRCLYQVLKRNKRYRGKVRPDMAEGCLERFDWSFIWWVLYQGRTSEKKAFFYNLKENNPEKVYLIKRPKDLRTMIHCLQ